MKTIKRILITGEGQNGTVSDPAYRFVKDVLKRRYGNSVTFAEAGELDEVVNKIRAAGYEAEYDGFEWNVMEPSDYSPGNVVEVSNDFVMKIKLRVIEVRDDEKHGRIAKVKYVERPRKRAIWVKAQTEESFEAEMKDAIRGKYATDDKGGV